MEGTPLDLKFISKQTKAVKDALQKPTEYDHEPGEDIFDWLQAIFGFQKHSVANQRDHLIRLLINSNMQDYPLTTEKEKKEKKEKQYLSGQQLDEQLNVKSVTLDDRSVREVMEKVLRSSDDWCEFMGLRDRNFSLQKQEKEKKQWRNLLFTGLYLLIWGEAANLRFMPECLSYIYHKMAEELWVILDDEEEPRKRKSKSIEGEDGRKLVKEEAFLQNVVTPIYDVIRMEQERCNLEKSTHSEWSNYDDLNEYFWSVDCFKLGWPSNPNEKFEFRRPENELQENRFGKVNFVEIRSFFHILRSFDRMWSFFILALQAMVIVAFNGRGDPRAILEINVLKRVLSIFITASGLKFVLALLDVVLDWKVNEKLRNILKVASGAVWVSIFIYAYFWEKPSLYYGFVVIYLTPIVLSEISFLFPFIRSSLEKCDYKIVKRLKLWSKPRLFVGREMHASAFSYLTYTLFWVMIIMVKLLFSYYIEILPLISPTKTIIQFHVTNFKWNDFFFHDQHNIGVVISLWAPIILVYFLDTQIWYAVISTVIGFMYGACHHLGEIRSLGMLRSRFQSSYDELYKRLIPQLGTKIDFHNHIATAHLWNKIIRSMRDEDLISNGESDKLRFPFWADIYVKGPLCLLASKISTALEMAKDPELIERIKLDYYMSEAIRECYASLKGVIHRVVMDQSPERSAINKIFDKVDQHIEEGILVQNYRMSALASLHKHVVELIKLLVVNHASDKNRVGHVLQNMLKVVRNDIIMKNNNVRDATDVLGRDLFTSGTAIVFPIQSEGDDGYWEEKINRLHLLLTLKESAMDVPTNLEARRRLTFFSNSLFMNMPPPPLVRNMLSFSVLTPYYTEDVLFSSEGLVTKNEDGVSILFYLKKIFPDEWLNFLERVKCKDENEINDEHLRLWVSYRGQTLFRTVRGIMYYREALELQAFLDEANNEEVFKEGYRAFQQKTEEDDSGFTKLCREIVDMKFTYVVSCQQYGIQNKSDDPRAQDIMMLMKIYPSLGVAYVDEEEDLSEQTNNKVYYSVLAKANRDIYRIKLPGPPILGEGKPENQNHAIIFTRGVALQTIDMNQDNYMEEALKMRNLLEEFRKMHGGMRHPTILGVREHIYTGSVSSVARFMSNQELSFVTIGQRMLANVLKVRFHYGHPDVFDRLFHLTRGGVSKASKVINLSEDIFAGFNSTLRGGNVTHHEYIQVGKGRDLGLDNISMFESKIASGNGEQTISRDIYRLGHHFDFFRMLSLYYTTVGFYFSTLITVLAVYIYLYGRLYLLLSGFDESDSKALQDVLSPQSLVQIGFLLGFPMLMEIGLEKGFSTALSEFIVMNLQLAPVFFIFSMGTKIHYYGRTLLHGGAKYRPTGRGFVVYHTKFVDIYKLYSRSHFVKAIELMILLTVYEIFSQPYKSTGAYMLTNKSMWFMVGTWLFAPFLFNPSGFEWHNIADDWCEWNKWISNSEESGVALEKSWEWWWKEEQEHLHHSGFLGIVAEILLSLRFFIYYYGLACHLKRTEDTRSSQVYALSWSVIPSIVLVMKGYSVVRQNLSVRFELWFRSFQWIVFLVVVFLVKVCVVPGVTLQDSPVYILAFISAIWGLLQIAQARSSFVKKIGLWCTVKALARGYEYVMGLLLFTPVAILAWFPFVSDFQTRILFNQSFSRGLQISRILGGYDK